MSNGRNTHLVRPTDPTINQVVSNPEYFGHGWWEKIPVRSGVLTQYWQPVRSEVTK